MTRLKSLLILTLWVSFVISKKLNLLDHLLFTGSARILFSKELILEIQETITKPRLKKYFGKNALTEMLYSFEPFIDLIEVESIVTLCRDPKDNFLIALAKDNKADYLITGDKDLLELKKFGKTKIKTITAFMKETKNYR